MQSRPVKRALQGTGVLVALIAIGWLARPSPVPVDLGVVAKEAMDVTVDDEGKTQVHDVYVVSAPLSGKLLRISGHVGDAVAANDTIVALMQPTVPSFHDPRYHEELKASLAASEAAVTLAEHEVHRNESAAQFSRTQYERAQALAGKKLISAEALDKAKYEVEANEASLASAKAQLEVRRGERASAAARLTPPTSGDGASPDHSCCLEIRAPVSGRILKVIQESEAVVTAGAPLIAIGDPAKLEVIADLLSSDAVKIEAGASVRIDGWGGPAVRGRVRRVDPAGFVKTSALGIDEQRVRTTIDFVDPPAVWSRLGHDYRVYVHVTVWHGDDVVTVPLSALFRQEADWAVFAVPRGRARVTPIEIGQRNDRVAEVVTGVVPGDAVVLHPSDRVSDGVTVSQRRVE